MSCSYKSVKGSPIALHCTRIKAIAICMAIVIPFASIGVAEDAPAPSSNVESPLPVEGDTPTQCGASGVSLQLPEHYEVEANSTPLVLCRVRNKRAPFPNFNVIRAPSLAGGVTISDTQLESELLLSYHQAGLTDAKLTVGKWVHPNGIRAYRALIAYTSNSTPMTSYVLLIPGEDESYILTGTVEASQFAANEREMESVAMSIAVPAEEIKKSAESIPDTSRSWGLLPSLVGLLALFVVGIVAIGVRLRRK